MPKLIDFPEGYSLTPVQPDATTAALRQNAVAATTVGVMSAILFNVLRWALIVPK